MTAMRVVLGLAAALRNDVPVVSAPAIVRKVEEVIGVLRQDPSVASALMHFLILESPKRGVFRWSPDIPAQAEATGTLPSVDERDFPDVLETGDQVDRPFLELRVGERLTQGRTRASRPPPPRGSRDPAPR